MPTLKQMDTIIRRNLRAFRKKGVTSVRPGFRCRGGWLTQTPAIVVGVKKKKVKVSKSELLPTPQSSSAGSPYLNANHWCFSRQPTTPRLHRQT